MVFQENSVTFISGESKPSLSLYWIICPPTKRLLPTFIFWKPFYEELSNCLISIDVRPGLFRYWILVPDLGLHDRVCLKAPFSQWKNLFPQFLKNSLCLIVYNSHAWFSLSQCQHFHQDVMLILSSLVFSFFVKLHVWS